MVDLLNKRVKHSMLGEGTVIAQDSSSITVELASRTIKLQYPNAFERYLVPEDAEIFDAIKAEMEEAKAIRAAAKAEEFAEFAALKSQTASSEKKTGIKKEYTPIIREDGQAHTYLVFQGATYDEESKGQFLWAPKYNDDGNTCHHWERMMDVREGDVIFHCAKGYIKAISRVKKACEESARPDQTTGDWTQWEKDGRRIDCEYHTLENPLNHGEFKEKILEYCNVKYSPFDKNGKGNIGYFYELNTNLAAFFIKEIAKMNPEVIDLDYVRFLLEE